MASFQEKNTHCSFTKEMEFEVKHFGADYAKLTRMIKSSIQDPREQERLLNAAAKLTL